MIIAGSLTVALATLFVALRFAVRIWTVKAVGWDDWTILFAAVGDTPLIALIFSSSSRSGMSSAGA